MVQLNILLLLCVAGALAQECAFPVDLVKPCSCFYRFIRCSGSKINHETVASIFQRLSDQLPAHEHRVDSFELINSGVGEISPAMFGKFQVKNYFRLRGNAIGNFSIGDFNELFMLDVSSNNFDHFDVNTFVGLNDLRILNAANIGFKRLKKEFFTHIRNLERLILSGNGIEHIDIDAFTSEYENNFGLARIDLSSNSLTKLPENVFTVLRRPEVIDLSNNRLSKITEIFNFSPDMVHFDPVKIILANNSLTNEQFNSKTFDRLVDRDHAIDLDLSGNQIRVIDQKVFGKLLGSTENTGKSRVNFANNPIECLNCAHSWLFDESPVTTGESSAMIRRKLQLPVCSDTPKPFARLSASNFSRCSRKRRAMRQK